MSAKVGFGIIQEFVELLKKMTGWKVEIKTAEVETGYIIDISTNGHDYSFVVEMKQQLASSMIPRIVERSKQDNNKSRLPILLATPYIAPNQAEALRKAGISYMDLKGNLHLGVPGMKIWFINAARQIKDRPRVHSVARQNMTSAGARLVYVLLNKSPRFVTNYRDLAKESGISIGSVKATLDWLNKKDFLRILGNREANKVLVKKKELLDLWIEAYIERLKPKLMVGRYETVQVGERIPGKPSILFRVYGFHPDEASWGGETGAMALANEPHYNPGSGNHTVYIRHKQDLNTILARHKLSRDPNGRLDMFEAFWQVEDEVITGNASPLVIYAELMSSGSSRCWSLASKIYDLYLKERIENDSRK